MITAELLRGLGAPPAAAVALAPPLLDAAARFDISTAARVAAFLANCAHETGGFAVLAESMDYSAEGLLRTWPGRFNATSATRLGRTSTHPANQQGIAEAVYGGRMGNRAPGSGDGWTFRGHGLLQTTGFSQYVVLAKALDWRPTMAELPAYLATPAGAALSAGTFWRTHGCNALADAHDLAGLRRVINGGDIGLDDVQRRYGRAVALLAGAPRIVVPSVAPATADDLNRASLAAAQSGDAQ